MAPISNEEAVHLLTRLRLIDVPIGSLARILDVNVTTVGRWLSGRNPMPPSFARVLEAVVAFHAEKPPKQPQNPAEPD